MAFTLNDISIGINPALATLTLHDTVSRQNRVVYVVVPMTGNRQVATQRQRQAKTLAKAALKDALAALGG